jgi:hypothetical protein
MLKKFLRALSFPFVALAAVILWFEEWLWEPIERLMRWMGGLPVLRDLEELARRAPPYVALLLFAVPAAALLPFKIVGLWLIARGHTGLGLLVFLAAKGIGTALLAWILSLTKPALMQLGWFAWLWSGFMRVKAWVYQRVTNHRAWAYTRDAMRRLRESLR